MHRTHIASLALAALLAGNAAAQAISTPPSGDNQQSSVSQHIGVVEVKIDYGRQLLGQGKKAEALKVFELNAKRNPNAWPVNVGLARGYSAVGRYKDALKYAKLALAQAPDDANRKVLTEGIKKLEAGKDMN